MASREAERLQEDALELTAAAAKHLALSRDLSRAQQEYIEQGCSSPITEHTLRLHHQRNALTLMEGARELRQRAERLTH